MSRDVYVYRGQELDVFACAERWKCYWGGTLRRWIRGDVLEVGAGLGVNTPVLQNGDVRSWHCVEPDPALSVRLAGQISSFPRCSVFTGTVAGRAGSRYDTILYIDVLEHIEADREELAVAATLLQPGGHLVVLSPAHQFLFTEFDAAIGHYRRYNKVSLRACSPPGCVLTAMFYLDSAGILPRSPTAPSCTRAPLRSARSRPGIVGSFPSRGSSIPFLGAGSARPSSASGPALRPLRRPTPSYEAP
jgi:hypothetical protein